MQPLTRRQLLHLAGGGAATLLLSIPAAARKPEEAKGGVNAYPFQLPKLPYGHDALEPSIDKETMEIHHGKHHQAYINNLNDALKDKPDLQKKSLEELIRGVKTLPQDVRLKVRNNGGGHINHTMFWQNMASPKSGGGGAPSGELGKAIDAAFGSFDKFKTAFSAAAVGRFGSGWAWLVVGKEKLVIESTANQDTPLMDGKVPILGLDVWEHAYYLKYRNLRAKYVEAWWNVVNWKDVAERYAAARKG
jgi:Fe-Mn family superoxide dismutase